MEGVSQGLQFLQWEKERAKWISSFPSILDASWEVHLSTASWGLLGKSARDRGGVRGSEQQVHRSWTTVLLLVVGPERRP